MCEAWDLMFVRVSIFQHLFSQSTSIPVSRLHCQLIQATCILEYQEPSLFASPERSLVPKQTLVNCPRILPKG